MSCGRCFVKNYVLLSAILFVCIGLTIIGLTIFEAVETTWVNVVQSQRQLIIGILGAIGGIFVIFGIIGIIGAVTRNACLLCIYSFESFIGLIFAIAITAISFLFLTLIFKNATCTTSSNTLNSWIPSVNTAVLDVQQLQGKNCQVYYPTYANLTSDQQAKMLASKFTNYSLTDKSLPVKSQDCTQFASLDVSETLTQSIAGGQMFLGCTGWCSDSDTPPYYYLFNDINQGYSLQLGIPPNGNCYQRLEKFFKNYGLIAGIVGAIISALLLINQILICVLCCQQKQKNEYEQNLQKNLNAGYEKNNVQLYTIN